MLDTNVTYNIAENQDMIAEMLETPELYEDRLFNVTTISLDGPFTPAWHICVLKEIEFDGETVLAFISLFDDTRKTFLKDLLLIQGFVIKSVTMYPEIIEDPLLSDTVASYSLNPFILVDFINRSVTTERDLSVHVNVDGDTQLVEIKRWLTQA